jgi:[acyl-carrier-protein] S-malonyltransferase
VTGRVAVALPGESAASSGMVDAWLADETAAHLTSPVQWEATSRALVEAGATSVVEIGPARVLGPLIRQVHPRLPVHLASGPDVPLATEDLEPALAGPAASQGET